MRRSQIRTPLSPKPEASHDPPSQPLSHAGDVVRRFNLRRRAQRMALQHRMVDVMENAWQPIETAPKDRHVLLFGKQNPMSVLRTDGSLVFTGYWDAMDDAWCSSGSTWEGPFYEPTHWMPLPVPPQPDAP